MKAYYLVFSLTLMVSLFYQAKTDKQWRWKLFWTFLPLFIFGAIRVDFGGDNVTYEEIFNEIHGLSVFRLDYDAHVEVGYQLLNRILPSFRSLLVLNALLLSLSLAVFSYYNISQKYLWIAVILIFLSPEKNIYGTLVAIRSGLCVSTFLLSFVLIQKRKLIPFFIITGLLSTIHTSALLFMPIAYFVGVNKPFTGKEVYLWTGATILILITSLTQVFDIIGYMISNEVFDRYEEVLEGVSSSRGVILVVNYLIYIICFILYFKQRGKTISQYENSLLRLGLWFSVSLLLGSLAVRASYFYDMFFIGAVVKIFSDKKAPELLRYGFLFLTIVSSYYSMFHIWMGAPWWDHAVYHSLLGSW